MDGSKMIEPGKWYEEFDENGRCISCVYNSSYRRCLGYESEAEYANTHESWAESIHPDDRERLDRHFADFTAKHPEGMDLDIEYRMMTKWGYHRFHDYAHAIRREDGSVISAHGVVFDIQGVVDRQNDQQEQLEESLAFINFFLDTYVSAYYVNLDDGSCKVYKRTEELNREFPIGGNLFDSLESYIRQAVHPEDRQEMTALADPGWLRDTLRKAPEYSRFFRDISAGAEKVYKVQVIRGADENHAALGFTNLTEEFHEQQKKLLGAIPLSSDILTKANIGLWAFELDEGKAPRMYADEAMLGLIGLDRQVSPEETYHAWYDHIDGGSYELVGDAVEKMVSGEHAEVQYPWHHPDGRTLIVRCGGVRNPAYTKGIRIEGTHQDVTRVLHLDEEMKRREKESLFNYFIASYDSAYFVNLAESTFEVLHMTDALAAVFGRQGNTPEVMQGFIREHIHPDDREMMLRMTDSGYIRERLKNEKAVSFTVREIYDGREKTMRCQIIRGTDDDHVAVGFMDITAETLEQQKRFLGAIPLSADILTKANIGLWSFELDEGSAPRMYADEAMLRLIGLEHQIPPEETYHAWYDHIDAGSYDLVNDAVEKMISGEHAEVQYPWHHPDGETWIVRCGGVRNPEYTRGIRIEGTHQNVTALLHYDEEQRKREEQQRADELARVKAEASDKAKTEFLFNMSHDIRTPMNAILGYTDAAIKHREDRVRVDENLIKIRTAGSHLLNLINDILEMSRIEAGKLEISENPMDLRRLLTGVEQMSEALAVKKSIEFSADTGHIRNPYVYSDSLHANEVLINLLSNAVKYTPAGGKVSLRAEQTGAPADGRAVYRFTVSDNGIGMSEEFQQHLFEAFSRENSPAVSRQEGAGLGLSIVRRIVDLSGGTIRVTSRLNEGSTFVVEVPLRVMDDDAVRAYEAENSPPDLRSEKYSFENKKVLLVEDNEMNREIAAEILEDAGMSVDTAEDGQFAVNAVTEKGTGYYDFILMDIQMPVMNGYEATGRIRALPGGCGLTIIALSANAFEEDIQKSLEAGMNAHVAKPIDVKVLLETMQRLISDPGQETAGAGKPTAG